MSFLACQWSFVVILLLPVLLLATAYVASLWFSLSHAGYESIDQSLETLRPALINDIEFRFGSILDKMPLVLSLWASTADFQSEDGFYISRLSRFAFTALQRTSEMMFLTVVKSDGFVIRAMRIPSGDVVLGEREASPMGATLNLTFWFLDGLQKTLYGTYPYDARTRPWYKSALQRGTIGFDAISESVIDGGNMLGIPTLPQSKKKGSF